jgi:hypothetical protein
VSAREFVCATCGCPARKSASVVNRAARSGLPLHCSRACFARSRRVDRSTEETKRRKREYDAARRVAHAEELAAKKRDYHRRTYNPDAARERRKARTFDQTAYCRRYYADPQKKAEKVAYDIERRSAAYADYAESWRLLIELEREIRARVPDRYERQKGRGYFTRVNERKRNERRERREERRRIA